jgi:hypothetical protein
LVIPAEKEEGSIPLDVSADTKPGMFSNVQVVAGGTAKPAWHSVQISSGEGEGRTFATVDQYTLAVIERPKFSLEASAETVHVVRGGAAEFQVSISRAESFAEPIHFFLENLPSGIEAQDTTAPAESANVTIRLTAAKDARPGRFSGVAILGRADGGQVQEAPQITVALD